MTEYGLTAASTFNYVASLTPSISSSSPLRGGTGGGTVLTISGSGFSYVIYLNSIQKLFILQYIYLNRTDSSKIRVTIAGSVCAVTSSTVNSITCQTDSYAYSSIIVPIQVYIDGVGSALNVRS